ncbi:MAG: hypothetical protein V1885_02825 [Candidatus Brennerbacteria bacterium]
MTDTLLRMTYLGDGISTDEEGTEDETEKDGEGPFSPLPVEEEIPEVKDPLESPDEV